jgi:apolipoprotein D and lipocalin family protein
MKTAFLVSAFVFSLNVVAMGAQGDVPATVSKVEINRYVGLWNELQRIPNEFQDNTPVGYSECFNTTAEYKLLANGKVDVSNTCYRESDKNVEKVEVAKAVARIVRNTGGSKLKVNFTGIALLRWLGVGDGNYWILALGPVNELGQYSWALVGSPKLDYGWVLSRKKRLSQADKNDIHRAKLDAGYDPAKFKSTLR